MDSVETLRLIRETGVIAILRAASAAGLVEAATAIRRGGIRAIEVALTTPGALGIVEEAHRRFGDDVAFGAGTVLDPQTARQAILAGAAFIVSPILDLPTVEVCAEYGVPIIPGIFTATEAVAAYRGGAAMVKLFPAEVGGPKLVAALRAPLPQLEIVPVGGVDLGNTADYLRSGAAAVGVGTSLASPALLAAGDMSALSMRAEAFIAAAREGRRRP